MDANGVVQGMIKRAFGTFKKQDYVIKYKILENGQRTTWYYKGNKLFSTITDKVKPEIAFTEEIPAKMVKMKKQFALMDDKQAQVKLDLKETTQKAVGVVDDLKYNVKGEIAVSNFPLPGISVGKTQSNALMRSEATISNSFLSLV